MTIFGSYLRIWNLKIPVNIISDFQTICNRVSTISIRLTANSFCKSSISICSSVWLASTMESRSATLDSAELSHVSAVIMFLWKTKSLSSESCNVCCRLEDLKINRNNCQVESVVITLFDTSFYCKYDNTVNNIIIFLMYYQYNVFESIAIKQLWISWYYVKWCSTCFHAPTFGHGPALVKLPS